LGGGPRTLGPIPGNVNDRYMSLCRTVNAKQCWTKKKKKNKCITTLKH